MRGKTEKDKGEGGAMVRFNVAQFGLLIPVNMILTIMWINRSGSGTVPVRVSHNS
jgi:hypothetical protein